MQLQNNISQEKQNGDINNTNVPVLRQQISSLVIDVKNGNYDFDEAKTRYAELYNTSGTLFDMIVKDIPKLMTSGEFGMQDEIKFIDRINNMLLLVKKIQDGKISQYNASVKIGQELGSEYLGDFM